MNQRLFALSLLALGLPGCGNSPLFNHRQADRSTPLTAPTPAACPLSFPKAGLCASIDWVRVQKDDETGTLILRFWDSKTGNANGPYLVPQSTVGVKLRMPAMGHGSSPVTVKPDAPGTFLATGVYFSMPGDWEIWLQLKNGNEILEQAKLDYDYES